jgi:hypothetical protein
MELPQIIIKAVNSTATIKAAGRDTKHSDRSIHSRALALLDDVSVLRKTSPLKLTGSLNGCAVHLG